MAQILQAMLPFVGVTGRVLLGLYFLIPGISKIVGFGGTAQYMATHGVPFVAVLLPISKSLVGSVDSHLLLPSAW